MSEELFPLRVVTGKRFCNRQKEKKLLKEFIKQKRPAVLISPRRYGKSSLAHESVEELKYPFCMIDFLTAYNDDSLCTSIIQGVSELISEIMPINMKTISILEKYFHGLTAAIRYKFITLEFTSPVEKLDPVRQVLEMLRGLEKLAKKLNKTVVVFIDEFQHAMGRNQQAILNQLKRTMLISHVPFVPVGVPNVINILKCLFHFNLSF